MPVSGSKDPPDQVAAPPFIVAFLPSTQVV